MNDGDSLDKTDSGLQPDQKKSIRSVFEQFEMMAMHQHKNFIDQFNDSQKDQIIKVMEKNEDHAYDYHMKKLDANKDIKIAKINAAKYNKITDRIVIVCGLLLAAIITLVILLFKESYFTVWIAFITGLFGGGLGGYGYAKSRKPATEE